MHENSLTYKRIFSRIVDAPDVLSAVNIFKNEYRFIDNITYHLRKNDGRIPFIISTYSDEWISYYLKYQLSRIDPIQVFGFETERPFRWDKLASSPGFDESVAHKRKFGISMNGYSIPIVDKKNRRALLSFNTNQPLNEWISLLDEYRDDFHAFSFDIHQKAITESYANEVQASADKLSPREVECMNWVARGKTYIEISTILDISENTVRTYLKTARVKLNSGTLAQAVSEAVQLGLISPHRFT